jgi:hypothetical protein
LLEKLKTYKVLIAVMLSSFVGYAQQNVLVTDNTTTAPHASSLMELNSTTKGFLMPRVALSSTTSQSPIGVAPLTSLLVYNTATAGDVTPGFYYWDGTKWNRFDSGNNIGDWKLLGNAGTNASTNFLGTTDNIDLVFRTNNVERIRTLGSNGKVGIGTSTPLMRLDVTDASTTTSDATIRGAATGNAATFGVLGTSISATGQGVFGFNSNASGTGVIGSGNNLTAQYLAGGSGGAFTSSNAGVYGYGNNTTASYGVWGVSINSTGVGVVGQATIGTGTGIYATNSAANGTAAGFAVDARSNQTGGSAIMANMQGNTYFSNNVISATINSSITGGFGIIADASNATGVAIQGQTSGAGASVGIIGINSGANVQATGIYGVASATNAGTAFTTNNCRKSIYGQASGSAGSYRFGVFGNGGASPRSGGVIGVNLGNTFYAGGALGYYSGGSIDYGVYGFGIAYQIGVAGGYLPYRNEFLIASKNNEFSAIQNYDLDDEVNFDSWSNKDPNTSIGLGIYGGVMGGWIKGLVYGTNLSGAKYGLYVHGKTITNNLIATLTNVGKDERVVTYAPTGMKVDVVDRGKGKLKNGKAVIEFSEDFSKLLSENEDITITVTPLGSSKGLFIEKYSTEGFFVVENESGNSNLDFNWIAVGVKVGYEKVKISEEIINKDFEVKMNSNYGVMFNDNNPENPIYSIWYDGKKVRFDKPPFNKSPEPLFREYQEPKILNMNHSIEKKMLEH